MSDNRVIRVGLLVLWGSLVAGLVGCGSNDVPPATMAALRNAPRYELLSLKPDRFDESPGEKFHGYHVLGSTVIEDSAIRAKLNDALRAGARENTGTVAACFNPRHGIRVVDGHRTIELLICFECLSAQIFEDGKSTASFLTSQSPQATFDDVLRRANVRLSDAGAKK